MKPFPIPVVALGPGSQAEDELDYLHMPTQMQTYQSPTLPEAEEFHESSSARAVLQNVLDALEQELKQLQAVAIDLTDLDEKSLQIVDQILGEGEVSALVNGSSRLNMQESVFAGIWRVIGHQGDGIAINQIEIGPVPPSIYQHDTTLLSTTIFAPPENLPPGLMNAPSILAELNDKLDHWHAGAPAHVVNLSLLPLSEEDVRFLGEQLGDGDTVILSRGYGNCRISNTRIPHCWQLVYFNSQDNVILHTIEITAMPDVACAAPEDLQDSVERLKEVLAWIDES
jgi:hydrogenase-1 operon protein HyaF